MATSLRKALLAGSLLTLLALLPTPCLAVESLVFGPTDFRVSSWHFHLSFHSFSAEGPGKGRLLIHKKEGETKTSAGYILFNSGIISLQDFLNGTEVVFERNLDLKLRNYLVVFLTGTPGAMLSIEIRAESPFVPPPEVEFTALPASISKGETSTLQWTTVHAQSVQIDQGIGTVGSSGVLVVSPGETTEYRLTASGEGGSTSKAVRVEVTADLVVTIISPSDGANIDAPHVLVKGSVTPQEGLEIGVRVNGILALVHGAAFAANGVPLQEGENVIIAEATDSLGNKAEASVKVYGSSDQDGIIILVKPESGVAPLESILRLEAPFNFINPSLTSTGPGNVEFLENPRVHEHSIRMTTPGLYIFTVEVRDEEGRLYMDSAMAQVVDTEILDALLKQKWNGMKDALGAGDTEKALSYFAQGAKRTFQHNFNRLQTHLGEISAGLRDIKMVKVQDGMAEYEMWAEQGGQAYSFYVLFSKDHDGIWRIEFF